MKRIIVNGKYFSAKDTLYCGQIFRFTPFNKGFKVFSLDKCCYIYNEADVAIIECNDEDEEFFYKFFDLNTDYENIVNRAQNSGFKILKIAGQQGKGIRILKQDAFEMILSFIISQNNNIPRIKSCIEKICSKFGKLKIFNNEKYFAFPTLLEISSGTVEDFKEMGLGYRAEYLYKFIKNAYQTKVELNQWDKLSTMQLKTLLMQIHGVGEKVADCVLLFGFNRTDSFPVDTWIEKVYRENFNGIERDRKKITQYFINLFKKDAGYFQQYLFYYKRSLEKNIET